MDPEGTLGRVGGDARVAVAVAADPAAPAAGTSPTRGGRAPVRRPLDVPPTPRRRPRRPTAHRGPRPGRAPAAAASVNSVASKKAIAVRTSSSGAGAIGRRSDGPPEEGDLLAQPAADVGVLGWRQARVVHPREQVAAAPQGHEDRPAASLGRMGGQDRRDRQRADLGIELRVRAAERPQPPDRLPDRVVEDAVAGGPLASTERPHAAARLGQVHELEVQGERADDGLDRARGRGRPGPRPGDVARRDRRRRGGGSSAGGSARRGRTARVQPARRRPGRGAHRAAGPRPPAGRARRPCRSRRVRAGPGPSCGEIRCRRARSRPVPFRGRVTMPSQPFGRPTFPTLVS